MDIKPLQLEPGFTMTVEIALFILFGALLGFVFGVICGSLAKSRELNQIAEFRQENELLQELNQIAEFRQENELLRQRIICARAALDGKS